MKYSPKKVTEESTNKFIIELGSTTLSKTKLSKLLKSKFSEVTKDILSHLKDKVVNESIDIDILDEKKKSKLKELMDSDKTMLDDRDYEYYSNYIGVSVEDLMAYIADSELLKSSKKDVSTTESEDSFDIKIIKNLVQLEIIDNEDVDNTNLIIKLDELAEDIYLNDTDKDIDLDNIGDYDDLRNAIQRIYDELTYNPNQLEIPFESNVVNFNTFVSISEGTLRKYFTGHETSVDRESKIEELTKELDAIIPDDNIIFNKEKLLSLAKSDNYKGSIGTKKVGKDQKLMYIYISSKSEFGKHED